MGGTVLGGKIHGRNYAGRTFTGRFFRWGGLYLGASMLGVKILGQKIPGGSLLGGNLYGRTFLVRKSTWTDFYGHHYIKIENNQQNTCTPSGNKFLVLLLSSQLLQQLFSLNKEQRKSPLPLRYDIKSKQ